MGIEEEIEETLAKSLEEYKKNFYKEPTYSWLPWALSIVQRILPKARLSFQHILIGPYLPRLTYNEQQNSIVYIYLEQHKGFSIEKRGTSVSLADPEFVAKLLKLAMEVKEAIQ